MELLNKIKGSQHLKLAMAIFGLNVVDVILTQIGINEGGYELNPVMRYLLGEFGWGAWAIKLVIVIFATFLILWSATKYPRQMKILFVCLIIFMVINCLISGMILTRALGGT